MNVTVDGADRLAATLADCARELQAMAATNRQVAAAIVAAAHPPILTGRLAGSLVPEGTDDAATVSSSVRYAPFQEARRGFLKAAVAATETKAVELHLKHVDEALAGVKGI